MKHRYTKHQVARGTLPDAENRTTLFLLKNVSQLRLTYQIRLLTFRAIDTQRKLAIHLPKTQQGSRVAEGTYQEVS